MKRQKIIASVIALVLTIGLLSACEKKEEPKIERLEPPREEVEEEPAITAEDLLIGSGEWLHMEGDGIKSLVFNEDLEFWWSIADISKATAGTAKVRLGRYSISGNDLKLILVNDDGSTTEEHYIATIEGDSIVLQSADAHYVSLAGTYVKSADTPREPASTPTQETTMPTGQINEDLISDIDTEFIAMIDKRGGVLEIIEGYNGGYAYDFKKGRGYYFFGEDASYVPEDYTQCTRILELPANLVFTGLSTATSDTDLAIAYGMIHIGTFVNDMYDCYSSMFAYKNVEIEIMTNEKGVILTDSPTAIFASYLGY